MFDTEGPNRSQLDALLKDGIGHVSALGLIGRKTPESLAKSVKAIQRHLVTETRLKILSRCALREHSARSSSLRWRLR